MVKYKFNLIFANTSLIIMFYTLTEYLFVENKEVVFFMLFCWYFATHGMSAPLFMIEYEMYDRTIVTIIQSKTSIIKVLVHRSIVQIIVDVIKAIPLFILLYLIGDYDFSGLTILSWLYILIGITLTIVSSYGIGFAFAGLALIYKRAGSFVGIMDYFILFFSGITIQINPNIIINTINYILPFIYLRNTISYIFSNSLRPMAFLPMLVSSVVWVTLGSFSLQKSLDYSIEKGLIYGV